MNRPDAIVEARHLPAPAKLNLFLHVTGRRADGYHLLETVFDLVDLADTLHLRVREDGQIGRSSPLPGVDPEQDLTVRAARLLAQASGCTLGVDIAIEKRIPLGGGLGGGSSDAATVLLALNRLWDLRWSVSRMAALGIRLGADVPVFVRGRAAYATGVGERLRPLALPPRHYVIVAPAVAVPTAAVFAAPELTRNTKPLKISGLSRGRQAFRGRNDLQDVVLSRYPRVAEALEALKQAARDVGCDPRDARMTGSGACVFLPLASAAEADRVRQRLHGRLLGTVVTARSLTAHPLRDWAFAPPRGSCGDTAAGRIPLGSRQVG